MNKFIERTHAMVLHYLAKSEDIEDIKDYEVVRVYKAEELSDSSKCLCDITNLDFNINVHAHKHDYLHKIEYYLHQVDRGCDRIDEGVKWLLNESSLADMDNEELKDLLKQNIPPYLYTHLG